MNHRAKITSAIARNAFTTPFATSLLAAAGAVGAGPPGGAIAPVCTAAPQEAQNRAASSIEAPQPGQNAGIAGAYRTGGGRRKSAVVGATARRRDVGTEVCRVCRSERRPHAAQRSGRSAADHAGEARVIRQLQRLVGQATHLLRGSRTIYLLAKHRRCLDWIESRHWRRRRLMGTQEPQ